MSPKEVIAVSEEVPKWPVMSGGRLERESIISELGNIKPMTKFEKRKVPTVAVGHGRALKRDCEDRRAPDQ